MIGQLTWSRAAPTWLDVTTRWGLAIADAPTFCRFTTVSGSARRCVTRWDKVKGRVQLIVTHDMHNNNNVMYRQRTQVAPSPLISPTLPEGTELNCCQTYWFSFHTVGERPLWSLWSSLTQWVRRASYTANLLILISSLAFCDAFIKHRFCIFFYF